MARLLLSLCFYFIGLDVCLLAHTNKIYSHIYQVIYIRVIYTAHTNKI